MIFFSLVIAGLSLFDVASSVTIHGHRGARAVRPENTIAAFEEALRVGVDVLEFDMVVTRDKKVVISHDLRLNPKICLHGDGRPIEEKVPVYTLTLRELKQYDCGTLRHPDFPRQVAVPKEKIPTLEEVFEFVKKSKWPAAKSVEYNIETKIDPDHPDLSVDPEEFVKLVLTVVKKFGLEKKIILQSFDYRTLKAMRQMDPHIRISALVEGYFSNLTKVVQQTKPDYISPDFDLLSKDKVATLQKMNVKVVPWTVNKPGDWKRMIDWNVDGIITDDPGGLASFINN